MTNNGTYIQPSTQQSLFREGRAEYTTTKDTKPILAQDFLIILELILN
jgi:hypothetical protein